MAQWIEQLVVSNGLITGCTAGHPAYSDLAAISDGILGYTGAGSGGPSLLTAAQVTAFLNTFTSSLQGLVPASGGGTSNFLRADGTWAAPGGGFTNPMTTLGDIIYENATPAAARLAGNTTATKNFLTQTGTGSASAAPAWGTITVADVPTLNQNTTGTAGNVTGTVAIANGGTGQTSALAGFDALSPLTTLGDMLYENSTPAGARLAGNTTTTKKFLTQTGTGSASAAPAWGTIAIGDVPVQAPGVPSGFALIWNSATTITVGPGQCYDKTGAFLISTQSTQVTSSSIGASGTDVTSLSGTCSSSGANVTGSGTSFLGMYPATPISGSWSISGVTASPSAGVLGDIHVGDLFGNSANGWGSVTAVATSGVLTLSAWSGGSSISSGQATRIENPTITVGTTNAKVTSITDNTHLTWNTSATNGAGTAYTIGKLNAATFGNVWVATSGTSNVVFLSTQRTEPLSGITNTYPNYRRVGSFTLSSGNIVNFNQTDVGGNRRYALDVANGTLAPVNGINATVYTDQSCAAFVPPTANRIIASIGISNATNVAYVKPRGFANDYLVVQVAGATFFYGECFLDPVQAIQWKLGGAGTNLFIYIIGYDEGIYQ